MTKIILFCCLLVSVLVAQVSSHATLIFPLSRGSAWRSPGNTFPVVYQDDYDFCQKLDNSRLDFARCGICGPVYNNDVTSSHQFVFKQPIKGVLHLYNQTHYSFEKGGPYYTGMIANHFVKGEVVEALIGIHANHKGHFEFRICNADGIENPDESCFEGNVLASTDGRTEFIPGSEFDLTEEDSKTMNLRHFDFVTQTLSDFDQSNILYKYNIQLPADLTCEHCIFQWRQVGTIANQDYVSCSDISIA